MGAATTRTGTGQADRLAHVDGLRGFALFGIFVVNSAMIASPYQALGLPDPAFDAPVDAAVRWFVACVFETKFYLLFSFLFGYSFTLQMTAAQRSGAAFAPRFLRRLVGLAVLGLAHAMLFYPGDILLAYALLGLPLLAWRRLDPGRALRRARWMGLLAVSLWLLLGLFILWLPGTVDDATAYRTDAQAALAAYRSGWAGTVLQNTREWAGSIWWQLMLVQGPFVAVMFLVGYALGRREALADPWREPGRLRQLLLIGLLPGLAGAAFYATTALPSVPISWKLLGLAVGLATAPLLSLSYGAAFLLLWRSACGPCLAAWLAPAGRMALTHYLMQSVLCAFVFTGWGLRRVSAVPPLGVLVLVLLLFGLQLLLSRWWMQRHVHGPVEGLLRALTLARWPRWRRTPVA
ncbi:DUF418 domain-containing protein [Xenophilus sp. Marseille-Q4582]|uniref:DUF418 domain-containing protein n=1 Tax=Xenophilus sp. Marseille-Q4582 TaxID=2866600 RepID=UPI001CE3D2B4|nr:DUF418 domain-containing protein [Xenophilus sp. Marseille-Q4582]